MTPRWGNTILFRSSQQLPRLRLGPLKGFFELTGRPSRALDSPHTLLPKLQRNKDTVRCVALGHEDTKETYAAKTPIISGVPPANCTKNVRMEEHISTLAPRIHDNC